MPTIQETLRERNPWWRGPHSVDFRPRALHERLKPFMETDLIVALVGLRRVGKTTLLLKAAEDAIQAGLAPERVVYFPYDEHPDASVRTVLKDFQAATGADLRQGRTLVILDEIQKHPQWQDELKAVYDAHKGHLKFLISGSESLFIRTDSRESLAGRLYSFDVQPLTFREFLAFRGVEGDLRHLPDTELAPRFVEYTRSQGFPELAHETRREVIDGYIRQAILDRVLHRDLRQLIDLRRPDALESILRILMEEPGQILSSTALAGELGVERHTVSAYLRYLEEAFLIRRLYNYAGSRRKVERKLRRFYPTIVDPGLPYRADTDGRGRVLEWVVATRLEAEFFWRDPRGNEVDVVLPGTPPVPVEVKRRRRDLSGLRAFRRTFPSKDAYLVTEDDEATVEENGMTVHVTPAYRFLLDPPSPDRPS